MSRRVLSATQIMSIGKLFEQHLSKEGCPEGKCRYTNGANDQSIAIEVGVQTEAVARLRRNVWGEFYYPGMTRAVSQTAAHDTALRISALCSELAMALKYMADKLGEDAVAKKALQLAQDLTQAGE